MYHLSKEELDTLEEVKDATAADSFQLGQKSETNGESQVPNGDKMRILVNPHAVVSST